MRAPCLFHRLSGKPCQIPSADLPFSGNMLARALQSKGGAFKYPQKASALCSAAQLVSRGISTASHGPFQQHTEASSVEPTTSRRFGLLKIDETHWWFHVF